MESVTTTRDGFPIPGSRPLTVRDLEGMPDDGHRYELIDGAPVLVVEVASPSTALHDLNTKKAAYQRLGVPSYWVIDPERVAQTVYELREDRYHESATVVGDQVFETARPYPVQVIPARLLGQFA
ncbi:Uma2 family endonuclease [Gordonia sp. VNK1]|jgi:Uma2 family endonuclease|uniref:Uma2 family endonuclease n=1 Tax=Gordonia oleivorans TaxID=3156618 RepID=UPI0032B50A27